MSIHIINGDLFETTAKYICHQVNCKGKMGSGVAKQIRERYPEVYSAYRLECNLFDEQGLPKSLLGIILPVQAAPTCLSRQTMARSSATCSRRTHMAMTARAIRTMRLSVCV